MNVRYDISLLTNDDIHWFGEGTHLFLGEKLGGHLLQHEGVSGAYFAVWAPNAENVSVIGDFNDWDAQQHPLRQRKDSGIWEGFVEGLSTHTLYKYHIRSKFNDYTVDKTDPFAAQMELPPKTASVLSKPDYEWSDAAWMEARGEGDVWVKPLSIYEVHLGSWMRRDDHTHMTYRELAPKLVEHMNNTGFTHVELLPITEHPFYGSWGYQTTGYFAPTARFGSAEDLMFLIDTLHQAGIGVILDWVPSHFPSDEHGLGYFDGTHLFEHADPRQGVHPDWGSLLFNYGRFEVQSFLLSSAGHWLKQFHIDGIRVDAVASMLYLDYSRKEGEWIPNKHGGREHLEAIDFLKKLNHMLDERFPGVQLIAEESTSWPKVSQPVEQEGLGFHYKWDMGWMHDTLSYFQRDPLYRKFHHNELTFRMMYAYSEHFVLALSHDEVVHGKGSLLHKMAGDLWQKFANLRLLYGYMYGQPGKKLMFMGCEWAHTREWDHDGALSWSLLDDPRHAGMMKWVHDLNDLYRSYPAMHEGDCRPDGFEWMNCDDADQSTLSFVRRAEGHIVLVVCNFTPTVRDAYRVGVPYAGYWQEVLNSDAEVYGGSGVGNHGGLETEDIEHDGQSVSLSMVLPPLAASFFVYKGIPPNKSEDEGDKQ